MNDEPILPFPQPPFAEFMNAKFLVIEPDRVEAEIRVERHLLNRNGTMHGGAILTIADNLGGTAAIAGSAEGWSSTTIESKTNFLRSIQAGDLVRFVCIALHRGHRTSVWQTTLIRSDGATAAIVIQTQLAVPRDFAMQTSNT